MPHFLSIVFQAQNGRTTSSADPLGGPRQNELQQRLKQFNRKHAALESLIRRSRISISVRVSAILGAASAADRLIIVIQKVRRVTMQTMGLRPPSPTARSCWHLK
jgi:hypothetical protein